MRLSTYQAGIAVEWESRPDCGLISGLLGSLLLKVGLSLTTRNTTLKANEQKYKCKSEASLVGQQMYAECPYLSTLKDRGEQKKGGASEWTSARNAWDRMPLWLIGMYICLYSFYFRLL